jgi:hypothetical protein
VNKNIACAPAKNTPHAIKSYLIKNEKQRSLAITIAPHKDALGERVFKARCEKRIF